MLRSLLFIAAIAVGCAAQDQPERPVPPPVTADRSLASVEGQVVDATTGQPLEGASVIMFPAVTASNPPARPVAYGAQTDYRGYFSIPNIKPDSFQLQVMRAGYLYSGTPGLPDYFIGPRIEPITLGVAEHKVGFTIRLQSIPKVSGRVTDSTGKPVKPQIRYIQKTFGGEAPVLKDAKVKFDDNGNFTISELQPGRYYLQFNLQTDDAPSEDRDTSEEIDVETYYPGVDRMSDASALVVTAGQDVTGLNIRMRKAARVMVTGHLADAEKLDGSGSVYLAPLDVRERGTQGVPAEDGVFRFRNVAPGRYLIATLPYALKNDEEKEHPLVAQEIVTVGKTDLTDVVLRSEPVASVSGKMIFEGAPQAFKDTLKRLVPGLAVEIRSIELPSTFLRSARADADGSFQIAEVPSGDYSITPIALLSQRGAFLKVIRLNGLDVSGPPLHIDPGSNQNLEFVIGFGTAQFSGVVRDANQKPVAGVRVSAWTRRPTLDGTNPVLEGGTTGQGGEFTFFAMPAGEYSVLAWEHIETGIDGVLEFRSKFMSRESTIEVKEGGSYTINPPLIPRAKSDPVAATIR